MNVYPYKTIKSRKFTKYNVYRMENGHVLVEYYFKNKQKSQTVFKSQNEVNSSTLPKNIKLVACWAIYESKTLAINIESPENKWF